jgi:hypothetical protein
LKSTGLDALAQAPTLTHMASKDELLQLWRDEVAKLKNDIEPFEAGRMHLGSRTAENPEWRDITQDAIDRTRRTIEMYERMIASTERHDVE